MTKPWLGAVTVAAVIASACASESTPTAVTATTPAAATPTTTEPVTEGATPPLTGEGLPEGPSALENMFDPSFPEPLVKLSDIISGGPPPDGIPPIDQPNFVSVDQAGAWLEDAEPVVYLDIEGDARAYPVQILIWHEIINDTVGGVPVSITYCPLCNSAVSYQRTINGVETTFGTSGMLYASALVMYDRATESLWTHFDGRAVAGLLTGFQLEPISSPLLAWSDFSTAFPEGQVLDRDATGHRRPYGSNPYSGYDTEGAFPFLFQGTIDDRASAMQRVVGVTVAGQSVAFTLEAISGGEARATAAMVGTTSLVVFWKAGQASALEDSSVAGGRDVGSVGVFSSVVDDQTLTFRVVDGAFVDDQTGSTWDIAGRSTGGELLGSTLTPIQHLDTFWFAWATYQPGSELVSP
ncbi:MAG TPA: DUF3179 domain-containing protein [Acidimicrobiia bacterium]|nr:DUF3179 domain-containing protein [Acidimicrobiia bacterium]